MIEHTIVSEKKVVDFGVLLVALKAGRHPFEGEEEYVEDFKEIPFLIGHLTTFVKGDFIAASGGVVVFLEGHGEQKTSDWFA